MKTCGHKYGAQFGCAECVRDVRARLPEFPLQNDREANPGPTQVPWPVAEKAWAAYSQKYGREQSVERLAERGGFSWGEMDAFFPGWRGAVDAWRSLVAERDEAQVALEAMRFEVKELRASLDGCTQRVVTLRAEAERLRGQESSGGQMWLDQLGLPPCPCLKERPGVEWHTPYPSCIERIVAQALREEREEILDLVTEYDQTGDAGSIADAIRALGDA